MPCSVMFCLPPPATRAAHCSGGLCYGGDDHMAALMCALCSVWSPQWGVGGTRRATDHDTLWRRRQKSPGRAAWWHGAPAHPNGSRGAPGCSSRVSRPILSVTRCARRVRLRVHARARRAWPNPRLPPLRHSRALALQGREPSWRTTPVASVACGRCKLLPVLYFGPQRYTSPAPHALPCTYLQSPPFNGWCRGRLH